MTKAELKQLETEKKHAFIARAYAAVLSCIPEQTVMLRRNVQIRLTHQGYNRYIRFHGYGKDMNIQIFGDGNVAEEVKQADFLIDLKELLSRLIPVFMNGMSVAFIPS